MVVRAAAGRDAIRAYVAQEAARGLAHVTALVREERETMAALVADLSEHEAAFKPAPGEFLVADALEHLNLSFERSQARLAALSSGEPFVWTGPTHGPGSLPEAATASFTVVLDRFLEGTAGVITFLEGAEPGRSLELTADHAQFGPFNWLEWAVYSHHVHTHDHVGQVEALRREIDQRRQTPEGR